MNPLVSILVPCYNAEQWLVEALQSLLTQTWKNIEIIVVDDGSTDDSLAIAKTFESPKLKVISQENRGASAARNRALLEAQGDFIQYLDADDLLSARKIESQILKLQQHSPGKLAVCGTIHFFDGNPPDDGILETGLPFLFDSDDPLDWLLKLLGADGQGGMVPQSAWLTPRSVSDAAGLWNEQLSLDDDGEYFSRVLLNCTGIRRVENEVSYYRKYKAGKNLSSGRSERHYFSGLKALDLKVEHILAKTDSPAARRAFAKSYMELAVSTYPQYPALTELALRKVEEMHGTDYLPTMGGWLIERVKVRLGWKAAKRISHTYRSWKNSFARSF